MLCLRKNGAAPAIALLEFCLLLLIVDDSRSFVCSPRRTTLPEATTTALSSKYKHPQSGATFQRKKGGYSRNRRPPSVLQQPQLFKLFDPSGQTDSSTKESELARVISSPKMLTSVLNSWAKSEEQDAAERCHEVLRHLKTMSKTSNNANRLTANKFVYGVLVNAYAHRRKVAQSEAVLRELLDEYDSQTENDGPVDSHAFASVLNSLRRSDDPQAPERCMAWVEEMKSRNVRPNEVIYNLCIQTYCKCKRPKEAMELFEIMLAEGIVPSDTGTIFLILDTYAKSLILDAPEQCEAILKRLRQVARDLNRSDLYPDVKIYNIVLHAYSRRNKPQQAEAILNQMLAGGDDTSGATLFPDPISYTIVIGAYAYSWDKDGPEHCERLLADLMDFAEGMGRKDLMPDTLAYQKLVEAYTKRGRLPEAENVLKRMTKHGFEDLFTYTTIMSAWARLDDEDAPEHCQDLFDQLVEASQTTRPNMAPDSLVYSALMDAYARHGRAEEAEALFRKFLKDPNVRLVEKPSEFALYNPVLKAWQLSSDKVGPNVAVERCVGLVEEMKELAQASPPKTKYARHLMPTSRDYNICMSCIGKAGRTKEAKEYLYKMMDEFGVEPTDISFSTVLSAYTKSNVPEQAEAWLTTEWPNIVKEKLGGQDQLMPNGAVYTYVINAYAKCGKALEAEALLRKLKAHETLSPNVKDYSSVINAWAKSEADDGPAQCLRLLSEMEQLSEKGAPYLKPNAVTYVLVLNAFERRARPQEAEAFLRKKLEEGKATPNPSAYNALLNAWCKSDVESAPRECRRILAEMNQLADDGKLDLSDAIVGYGALIHAYTKQGQTQKAEKVLQSLMVDPTESSTRGNKSRSLNLIAITSLIQAYAFSERDDGPENCQRLLQQTTDYAKENGRTDLLPDTVAYTATLNAYGRRGRAEEADALLRSIVEEGRVKPNRGMFTVVINAWAKSNSTDAPERCEQLISDMEKLGKEGNKQVVPDDVSYGAYIHTYARHNRAREAEAAYKGLVERGKIAPSYIIYNTLIDGWAKSDSEDGAAQCEKLLEEMKNHNFTDVVAYTALMNAYSRRGKAVEAESILSRMMGDGVTPDTAAFGAAIRAWEKSSNSTSTVEQCKRLLSEMKEQGFTPNYRIHDMILEAYLNRGMLLEGGAVDFIKDLIRDENVLAGDVPFRRLLGAFPKGREGIEQRRLVAAELKDTAGRAGKRELHDVLVII